MLKRSPVSAEFVADDIDLVEELHKEAKTLLYYEASKQESNAAKADAALRAAMIKLGIHPFTDKSVSRYKFRKANLKNILTLIMCGVLVVGAVSCIISIIAGIVSLVVGTLNITCVVLFGLFAALWAIGWISIVKLELEPDKTYSWQTENLSSHKDPIPEFALQSAVDIKKECPNVEFRIESLRLARTVRQPDPFLMVRASEKWYYIEVWNEPRFKQQRTV